MTSIEFPDIGVPLEARHIHQDNLGGRLIVDYSEARLPVHSNLHNDLYINPSVEGDLYCGMFAPLSIPTDNICIPAIESFENFEVPPPQAKNTHYT